ncbi:hydantoinase B/oxoprolinase family protein [Aneurinibacillus terranovensis]|uniref:hydantoinase B/oxoprolinase family protein n=1 Tax=Aneurinibacillus terranovensis TaxID=278991 RepID=UPI0004297B47|nr:hydantoinase B/oxoprolinase family protein [Aneurinibacillus terranovensis]
MEAKTTPQYLENPITTEIIRNAFISAAEEMNARLARSAFSPIIYEMKDCSVCLFNKDAELLGQSAGLPIFMGNLDGCIKYTTELIGGKEMYKPGDLYIMNDSYITGTHLNDITIFSPIFLKNELVGFAANRAHWLDIGAKDPGYPMDATEIYQEGVRIPPTKIYDAGNPRQDVIELIVGNSRLREAAMGDLNAQIAACRTGEQRYQEIIERFGNETVERCIVDIFTQSELMDKQVIANIPDGVYEAEGCLDNDGVSKEPVPIKVKVVIEGDAITIDLTGSSQQRPGQTNCGFSQTISACRVAFKNLISPHSPVTGGNFRTMNVIAPKRTIFHAQEPAACGWYFTPLGILIDLIIKALSPVMKDQCAAAHYGDSMVITFTGLDPKTQSPFLNVEATAGGWGAFAANDGESGLINNVNGDFKNLPIEVIESKYPLKVFHYGFRQDTGGPGANRGGLGITKGYQVRAKQAAVSLWFDRSKTTAWGLFGGKSAAAPEVIIEGDGKEEQLLKVNAKPLKYNDRVTAMSGGGGGYGHPFDRDPGQVLEDVIDQYISKKAALQQYGVVIKDDILDVDQELTRNYREKNRVAYE